jgi:hypothetical protein
VFRHVLSAALVAALVCACGSAPPPASYAAGTGRFKRGSETFQIQAPPAPWRRVDAPGGDLAWLHPEEHAVMAVNAACKGHHDPPLTILMNDLLIGTTDRKVLLGETVVLDGRQALHQVVAVRVDGVPVIYDLYVTKKDGCVYDLTLVAPPRAYDQASAQFVGLVAGFKGGVQ